MKKRIFAMLLVAAMGATMLTGCGDKNAAVKETVTTFMDGMKDADSEKVKSVVSDDASTDSDVQLFVEPEAMAEELYAMIETVGVTKDDLSDEATGSVTNFLNYLMTDLVESYEIKEVKVDGDEATVICDCKFGINPQALTDMATDSDIVDKSSELISNYQTENMDELVALAQEDEKSMYVKLFNDIFPDYMAIYQDYIKNYGGVDGQMQIKLTKTEDDKWLVTDAQESVEQ